MTDNEKVLEFIQSHNLAVLSTVTSNYLSESAVIGFWANENFELFVGTWIDSRKYQNLMKNPSTSLVIGWEQGKTVQYEGYAIELTDERSREALNAHLSKIPSAAKYISDSREVIFHIKPKWIRFTDLTIEPWQIIEIKF